MKERNVDLYRIPREPNSYWLGAKVRWIRKMKEIGNYIAAAWHEQDLLDALEIWP